MQKSWHTSLKEFGVFLGYVFSRFKHDQMQPRAASLTFTSLLAMVPLLAISFAIFAAFPAFENLKSQATDFIFDNLVPEVGDVVKGYLESFTAKAQGGLSAVGIIFLGVTSIMLLVTISGTFNQIWRARQPRSVFARLLVFWAILTLGPIFLGANISITSALIAYTRTSGIEDFTGPIQIAFIMPFVIQTIGFTLMFLLIPNYPVRKRDAAIGGIVVAILLESLKKGFTFYVTSFPTYETIYGAMATIPIFLLWIYLSWIVVLFGAQLTASLPEWRAGTRKIDKKGMTLTEKLTATLSVLSALREATEYGKGLTERQLPVRTGLGPEHLVYAMNHLEDLQFIAKADTSHWHLCRDLKRYSLYQLCQALRLNATPQVSILHLGNAWGHRLGTLLQDTDENLKKIYETDLDHLLEKMRAEEGFDLLSNNSSSGRVDEINGPKGFAKKITGLIGIGSSINQQ